MARRRRREIREDDIVIEETTQQKSGDFFEDNRNTILIALGVILLLLAAFFAYKQLYKEPKEKRAAEEMYMAQHYFQQDSFAQALTNVPGGFMGFEDIASEYSGTKAGNLSNYYAGVCYLNLGKYEAALEAMSDFSPSGSITSAMKYGVMGDAESELNNLDKAYDLYKKAAKSGDIKEMTAPYYLMKAGLLAQKLGNNDNAKDHFTTIKEDFPESREATNIQNYINRVSAN